MTKQASLNKGWSFTFHVESLPEDENPVLVVILGEVGDVENNTWIDQRAVWYIDSDHAASIATDAVTDKFDVGRDVLTLLEVRYGLHQPKDLVGLQNQALGVWI